MTPVMTVSEAVALVRVSIACVVAPLTLAPVPLPGEPDAGLAVEVRRQQVGVAWLHATDLGV